MVRKPQASGWPGLSEAATGGRSPLGSHRLSAVCMQNECGHGECSRGPRAAAKEMELVEFFRR